MLQVHPPKLLMIVGVFQSRPRVDLRNAELQLLAEFITWHNHCACNTTKDLVQSTSGCVPAAVCQRLCAKDIQLIGSMCQQDTQTFHVVNILYLCRVKAVC